MSVDLSGDWIGIYNYPHSAPPTGFSASLRDHGGLVTGETSEPSPKGGALHAVIEGNREGDRLVFTKIYDDLEFSTAPVRYDGRIDPGGDEIEGKWTIPGILSGSFLMVRGARADERVEERISEEVEK